MMLWRISHKENLKNLILFNSKSSDYNSGLKNSLLEIIDIHNKNIRIITKFHQTDLINSNDDNI